MVTMLETDSPMMLSPTRRLGRVEKGILDTLESQPIENDLPAPMILEDLAFAVYQVTEPSAAQRESLRRAVHRLEEDGLLDSWHWGGPAGKRERKVRRSGCVYKCEGEGCHYCEGDAPRYEGFQPEWDYEVRFANDFHWREAKRYAKAGEPWHLLDSGWSATLQLGTGARFLVVRRRLTDQEQTIAAEWLRQRAEVLEALGSALGREKPRRLVKAWCWHCQETFIARSSRARYCSPHCQREYRRLRREATTSWGVPSPGDDLRHDRKRKRVDP